MDNPFSALLVHNHSQFEKQLVDGIEQYPNRLSKKTVTPEHIAKQWDPKTCPESLLPWLAWSLSVDEWDEAWPVATKRDFIANSVKVHKHKGTVGSVKRALASLGVNVEFFEWFEDIDDIALAPYQSKQPHTFMFIAWAHEVPYTSSVITLDETIYRAIRRVTERTKPQRAHFEFLVGAKLKLALKAASISSGLQVARTTIRTEPVKAGSSKVETQWAMVNPHRIAKRSHYMSTQHVNAQLAPQLGVKVHLQNRRQAVSRLYLHNDQRLPAAKHDFAMQGQAAFHLANQRVQVARFYCLPAS
ncbi:phage tail protein I [Pseudoalteromonas sp. T1lg65]|uniref:phage tail protein I n=1 Tax=Pseudoalteromonas sp. T1lg65 TaxID=2077101 RepID=UPI003F79E5ED